jgi:ribosomal protein S18 acetylase RimI-like enzyme
MKLIQSKRLANKIEIKLFREFPNFKPLQLDIRVWYSENLKGKNAYEIGHAYVHVYNGKAQWVDIIIHDEMKRQGIGSEVVTFMKDYLRTIGVKEIWGDISPVDNVERTISFWKKNGFLVERYASPKGFVAKVTFRLTQKPEEP